MLVVDVVDVGDVIVVVCSCLWLSVVVCCRLSLVGVVCRRVLLCEVVGC